MLLVSQIYDLISTYMNEELWQLTFLFIVYSRLRLLYSVQYIRLKLVRSINIMVSNQLF